MCLPARPNAQACAAPYAQATVYRCLPSGQLEVVQVYQDADVSARPVREPGRGSGPAPGGAATTRANGAQPGLPDAWCCATLNLNALQSSEEFYVCKWSVDERSGAPLLLLAGKNGLLQVVDCATGAVLAVSAAPS